ncbi:hypothetical protein C0993_010378, partial [Termitomyces sp. T159_Od127]
MPDVQLSYGPMLIGVFLNMILYGRRYLDSDPFETANSAFDMFIMYEPLILRFGTTKATTMFPTLFASEPIVVVAVSTPIQLFFAWRIKKLTKSVWIPLVISLTSDIAGGCWTGTKIAILKLFAKKPELHTPALVWFLSACVADILITASLVHSLSKQKTGFSTTDDAISKIIKMTVQTGMLTASIADRNQSSSQAARVYTGNVRHQTDTSNTSNDDSTSPTYDHFELEARKTSDSESSYKRDLEFGITVTK